MRKKESLTRSDRYRKLLLDKKAELTAAPKAIDMNEPLCIPDGDEATILHDRFVATQIAEIDCQTLKLVDLALERLDSHEYGVCFECGETISAKRLSAIPWATLCISCQERATRTSNGDRWAA